MAIIVNNAPVRVLALGNSSTRSNIKVFAEKPTNHSRGLARPTNHSSSEYFSLAAEATLGASGGGA